MDVKIPSLDFDKALSLLQDRAKKSSLVSGLNAAREIARRNSQSLTLDVYDDIGSPSRSRTLSVDSLTDRLERRKLSNSSLLGPNDSGTPLPSMRRNSKFVDGPSSPNPKSKRNSLNATLNPITNLYGDFAPVIGDVLNRCGNYYFY